MQVQELFAHLGGSHAAIEQHQVDMVCSQLGFGVWPVLQCRLKLGYVGCIWHPALSDCLVELLVSEVCW